MDVKLFYLKNTGKKYLRLIVGKRLKKRNIKTLIRKTL